MSYDPRIFCANLIRNAQLSYGTENAEKHLEMQKFVREKSSANYLPRFPMLSGHRIPEDITPKTVTLKKITRKPDNAVGYWNNLRQESPYDSYEKYNTLGDTTNSIFGWIVSEKTRMLIEEIQPGQHIFSPISILKVNGEKIRRDYYTFNLCNDWTFINSLFAVGSQQDLKALESSIWSFQEKVYCPWRFFERLQLVGIDTHQNTSPLRFSKVIANHHIALEA